MARPQITSWTGTLFRKQLNAVLDWLTGNAAGGVSFVGASDFAGSSLTYSSMPLGAAGGDRIVVNGQDWVTLPSSTTHFYATTSGGLKARRNAPIMVVASTGQSNELGSNAGGPNPASKLVGCWDGVTVTWGSSDITAQPWTRSSPHGNGGKNNIALARAHRLSDDLGCGVAVIRDGTGGTSIDEWVAAGTSSARYAAFKTKVEAGLAALGLSKVSEIIYAQGEEDYTDDFATHLANLHLLRDQLRAESWCDYDTPIYFIGPSNLHDRYQWSEAMRYFAAKVDSMCIYVPSNGLRTEYEDDGTGATPGAGDFTHWLGESLWEMGYYRIARAGLVETHGALFYGRGVGPATPASTVALATFISLVSRGSWTAENSPNGQGDQHALAWGFECFAENYSAAFGYQTRAEGIYSFAEGRGHTTVENYSIALGSFSLYTTAQADPVLFQLGYGTTTSNRANLITGRASGAVEIQTAPDGHEPAQDGEYVVRQISGDDTKLELRYVGQDSVARTVVLDSAGGGGGGGGGSSPATSWVI